MITMDEVNSRLEASAQAWERICEEKGWKHPEDCNWPEYFRGLKNFTSLDEFSLSSADGHGIGNSPPSVVRQYIKEHNLIDNYEVVGYTGGCTFTRKY